MKTDRGEIFDADLYSAPVSNAQVKANVSAKQELVIQEARENECAAVALGDGTSMMSAHAAARLAGCSPDTVLRWIEEGAVKAWRVSPRGWFRIDGESLTRFLNRVGINANYAGARQRDRQGGASIRRGGF